MKPDHITHPLPEFVLLLAALMRSGYFLEFPAMRIGADANGPFCDFISAEDFYVDPDFS